MNWKNKLILIFLIVSLFGIWAILAFCISNELVSRFSLWVSLITGSGSICISVVALLFSVHISNKEKEEKKKKFVDDARLFIHDNNDEIDYLPYCIYASAFDRHGHHSRKIYDGFCRLSDEMQKEVLIQSNYNLGLIKGRDWIYEKIEIIDRFAKEYGFGDSFLYDGGKYFLRGYDYKSKHYKNPNKFELKDTFNMYNPVLNLLNPKGITVNQYFEGYAYRRFRDPDFLTKHKYVPPCDLLIELKGLRQVDEYIVAVWMCSMIENLHTAIVEYFYGKWPENIISNDGQPEFFEDKFYMVLDLLYNLKDYSNFTLIKKDPYDNQK